MTLKVGFLGNCQAQSMQSWASASTDVSVAWLPPVWLIKEQETAKILDDISACDFLFTQRLSDDFAIPELQTANLKASFPGKVISWPNMYFDGYFPGLKYKYNNEGKIVGPLDDYHIDIIEKSYISGSPPELCVKILDSKDIFDWHPDPISSSLKSLSDREGGLDVIVSDYLFEHLHRQRLFYSMNHPVNELLLEMIHRLFGFVGEQKRVMDLGPFAYPLDKVFIPVNPAIRERFGMRFSEPSEVGGVEVCFEGGSYRITDTKKEYDYLSLVDCFYRIYDIVMPREAKG